MSNPISPLRYPGGKAKLSPLVKYIIEKKIEHNIDTYIEPFAGGAGIALDLLINETVPRIIINDYDKAIYSFWKAIITEPNRFIQTIITTPVTIDEWNNQKNIYNTQKNKYSFELGFATFFLNRTTRSGILTAGPIGGYEQDGNYLIDARFNKQELIKRINRISQYRKRIKLYNKDIRSFVQQVITRNQHNSFIYFDPPYFVKGKKLYINYFSPNDHIEIMNAISENVTCKWLMTYDDEESISKMYEAYLQKKYNLNYSLANKGKSSELMIFSSDELCPSNSELEESGIKIVLL